MTPVNAKALELNFSRPIYILRIVFLVALLIGCATTFANIPHYMGIILGSLIFLLTSVFLLSHIVTLSMDDPALRIDDVGIFDKRLTRDPIEWSKIRSVYPLKYIGWTKPYCIKIDVGVPWRSGVKIAFWGYFLTPRWTGVGGWSALIELQGLESRPSQLSQDFIINQILESVRRFRPQLVQPPGYF